MQKYKNKQNRYASYLLLVLCTALALDVGAQQLNKKTSTANLTSFLTIKIAVIDTGYDFKSLWGWKAGHQFPKGLAMPKICPGRHADFTREETDKEYLKDNHGHGTHIAGIIAAGAQDVDYCLVILKFYDPKAPGQNNLANTIKAFNHAIDEGVDIINYSAGGTEYSAIEKTVIMRAINKGIKVVVAAGNERSDIDKHPYYPASYSALIEAVGNVDTEGKIVPSSNYGRSIASYRMGNNVLSLLPDNTYGYMTGTSQAAAVRTGELVKEVYRFKNFDSFNPRKYLKSYKLELAS